MCFREVVTCPMTWSRMLCSYFTIYVEGLLVCRVLPRTSCLCLLPFCFLFTFLGQCFCTFVVCFHVLSSKFLCSSRVFLWISSACYGRLHFALLDFGLLFVTLPRFKVRHLGSFSYTVTPDWASQGQQKNIYREPWTVVFSKAELLGRSSRGRKSSTCMISDRSTHRPLIKPWFKAREAFTKNTSWHQLLVFRPDTVNPPLSSSSTLPVLYQQVCACTSV